MEEGFLQVCSGLRICEVKVRNNRAGEAQPGGPSFFLWGSSLNHCLFFSLCGSLRAWAHRPGAQRVLEE